MARLYQDWSDVFVIDTEDASLADAVEAETGLRCVVTETVMRGPAEKQALARTTMDALRTGP